MDPRGGTGKRARRAIGQHTVGRRAWQERGHGRRRWQLVVLWRGIARAVEPQDLAPAAAVQACQVVGSVGRDEAALGDGSADGVELEFGEGVGGHVDDQARDAAERRKPIQHFSRGSLVRTQGRDGNLDGHNDVDRAAEMKGQAADRA